MTPQTFKILIDKNHLTVEALCIYFSSDRDSVQNWITGKTLIPQSVSNSLRVLDDLIEEILSRAQAIILETMTLQVPILRYENEEDFFEFDDDAQLLKSFKVHQGLIARVLQTLQNSGITAYAVSFHKSRYLTWAKAEGLLRSDRSTRATWAALQDREGW